MSDMSQRGHTGGTFVLSVQVQWEHQVRPSGVPDGVAVAFPQEALRTVQNAFSLHEALRCEHAQNPALDCLCEKSMCTCDYDLRTGIPSLTGQCCLVGCSAMAYTMGMEVDVLVRRCWLGERGLYTEDGGTKCSKCRYDRSRFNAGAPKVKLEFVRHCLCCLRQHVGQPTA